MSTTPGSTPTAKEASPSLSRVISTETAALVRKGEEWAPESGDVLDTYEHRHDAVAFETRKTDAYGSFVTYKHLIFWDGKRYTEY